MRWTAWAAWRKRWGCKAGRPAKCPPFAFSLPGRVGGGARDFAVARWGFRIETQDPPVNRRDGALHPPPPGGGGAEGDGGGGRRCTSGRTPPPAPSVTLRVPPPPGGGGSEDLTNITHWVIRLPRRPHRRSRCPGDGSGGWRSCEPSCLQRPARRASGRSPATLSSTRPAQARRSRATGAVILRPPPPGQLPPPPRRGGGNGPDPSGGHGLHTPAMHEARAGRRPPSP